MTVNNVFFLRKSICCGTIFVGPFGEVMVDPNFLQKCSLHVKPKPVPKVTNSLFTIEKIIESELRNFESSNYVTGETLKQEGSAQAVTLGDQESDEGFYDKPSTSPTNSIEKMEFVGNIY